MNLTINGEERRFDDRITLAALVEQMGMKQDRVAVELNRDIVQRDKWSSTVLNPGDHLEIVHFVGGGFQPSSSASFPALPADLSPEALARLSPNRVHESNWLMSLLCRLGLHRWYFLNLGSSIPAHEVALCRWCSKVKIHGVIHGD
jgi:thiamine biosynthesis protein ThiS